ncbi:MULTISPECIES: hypothetical protein [Lysinibacillus]|uniref:hypothetical protein n=1 Tax=Lysinibacillus TaxID=400634 RepID=UPI001CBC94AE|nr:hypothetical protein [Lysinibacillus sphaericus]
MDTSGSTVVAVTILLIGTILLNILTIIVHRIKKETYIRKRSEKMYRNNRSYYIVAITNIIIVCLAQIFYQSLLEESINIAIFEFLIFPLLFVLINFFLWFSQFKLEFYEHTLFAYLAFFVYVIVSSILKLVIIGPAQELPPGEIVLGADLIMILAISIIQCLILLFLNFICYIGYRIFGTQKK